MNIRDIKRKKITEMTTDEILAERKFYEDVIANCKYEKPQDIADLFEAYTMLIWKHKQVGRVYDFYFDGLKEERDGGDNLEGSDHVVLDTLRALARTPDLNVVFEEIHCIGNPKDGFRFGQVVWNDATTVDGVGPMAPAPAWAMRTGKTWRCASAGSGRSTASGVWPRKPVSAATPHTSGFLDEFSGFFKILNQN